MDIPKNIGRDNVVQIIEIKGAFYPIFDPVLSILYVKREGLATKEILAECNIADYNQLYRLLTRLVNLEMLKPDEEKMYIFTHKGIDLYRAISQMDFSRKQTEALGKKHSLKILKSLEKQALSWNHLNQKLNIGQSSMKNALDGLLVEDFIQKNTKG